MNANELADELEDDYWDGRAKKVMLESAKMLRQQQAEIEALKEALTEGGVVCARCGAIAFDPVITQTAKTLTDEEILELTKDSTIFEYREFDDDMVRFAKAILKKASEK
jgi:hypothetical protein